MDLINTILEWAETEQAPANFNTRFVLSCQEQLKEKGSLSNKQKDALRNIIEKFKIGQIRDSGQKRQFGKQ
jgi:hypothetical protein